MKLRITSRTVGRIIVYVYKQRDLVIPVVLRLKKDKIFGENLALNNKKAKSLILDMMDRIMGDINKNYYKKDKI